MATTSRGITIVQTTRTSFPGSDVRLLTAYVNRLARAVSQMMPGCLQSDPAVKAGTGDTKKLRAEAFSFWFRGKLTAAAAQEKVFTASTHDLAQNKQAWYVLSTQTDGTTFTITKAADQTIGTDVYPTVPDNEIAIGWLKIVAMPSGGTWVGNTDALVVGAKIASLTFVDNPGIALIGDESSAEITG